MSLISLISFRKTKIFESLNAPTTTMITNCSHCGHSENNHNEAISGVISHTGVTNNIINSLATVSCASWANVITEGSAGTTKWSAAIINII